MTRPASQTQRRSAVSKKDYELLSAFRYALRGFIHFSKGAASRAGIAPQQHQALLAVRGFPGRDAITIGELAERLRIRHHSAVGLVNRMVHSGLLARAADKKDRRRVLVAVTPRGLDLLENLAAAHKAELQRIEPELRMILNHLKENSA